ncbi:MAG: ATP-binding protein [Qingshengfaniella sp.]
MKRFLRSAFRVSTDQHWRLRLSLVALSLGALAVLWITNAVLSERYSTANRAQSELRLALFSGGLMSELRRNSIVPQLLSRDPILISALAASDFSQSSQRLIEYRDEITVAQLMLLDASGRSVASSDRALLGGNHRTATYMVEALRSNATVFSTVVNEAGLARFYYSRKIEQAGTLLGVIVIEVDLRRFERSWAGITDAVMVTDSTNRVLLTTEQGWRGRTEEQIFAPRPPETLVERIRDMIATLRSAGDVTLQGEALMRTEARIPFQGWRIVGLSSFASVRGNVNAVLAVELMVFAIAAAGLFYLSTLAADRRSAVLKRESAQLKRLNTLLQREISEREKAEKSLQVAEQSLAQSSKLAALGEMATAVSHELNQPLAAMKTYLAASRLLLQRHRNDEAVASFQRINDLIDRMATITRQLKSYAGKGNDTPARVDMRDAVAASLAMMEPQLRQRRVEILCDQPDHEVPVLADRVRLEQVIVNLLRNAIDATRGVSAPEIGILISYSDSVRLSVRDNGTGITDMDKLFEPFHTTKPSGEGLGLGLAISSSIVTDLGGRLTARNREDGGAVFTIILPLYDVDSLAAE